MAVDMSHQLLPRDQKIVVNMGPLIATHRLKHLQWLKSEADLQGRYTYHVEKMMMIYTFSHLPTAATFWIRFGGDV